MLQKPIVKIKQKSKIQRTLQTITTLALIANKSLAVSGDILLKNQTDCKITPILDGFSNEQLKMDIPNKLTIKMDQTPNTSRLLSIPIALSCHNVEYTEKLLVSSHQAAISISVIPSHSYTPAQLVISGDNRIDGQNKQVVVVALPQKLTS